MNIWDDMKFAQEELQKLGKMGISFTDLAKYSQGVCAIQSMGLQTILSQPTLLQGISTFNWNMSNELLRASSSFSALTEISKVMSAPEAFYKLGFLVNTFGDYAKCMSFSSGGDILVDGIAIEEPEIINAVSVLQDLPTEKTTLWDKCQDFKQTRICKILILLGKLFLFLFSIEVGKAVVNVREKIGINQILDESGINNWLDGSSFSSPAEKICVTETNMAQGKAESPVCSCRGIKAQ
jgi:hypothetical protein